MKKYCIISLRNTPKESKAIALFRKIGEGLTFSLDEAGIYTDAYMNLFGDVPGTFFVPIRDGFKRT